jgi:hypothetical protein
MRNTLIISFFLFVGLNGFGQDINPIKTKNKAVDALQYCKEKGFNTEFCVFVDMSIHSGKNRLIIWQFKNDSIIKSGLCSHGCCDNEWGVDETKTDPTFNNIPESHCSSLGKFKVGKRGYSNWGINVNYKLYGLETTNNKAYSRLIVLHSWEEVKDYEVYPEGTAEGWGCPAVSNELLMFLDTKLKTNSKPTLFWIYTD